MIIFSELLLILKGFTRTIYFLSSLSNVPISFKYSQTLMTIWNSHLFQTSLKLHLFQLAHFSLLYLFDNFSQLTVNLSPRFLRKVWTPKYTGNNLNIIIMLQCCCQEWCTTNRFRTQLIQRIIIAFLFSAIGETNDKTAKINCIINKRIHSNELSHLSYLLLPFLICSFHTDSLVNICHNFNIESNSL